MANEGAQLLKRIQTMAAELRKLSEEYGIEIEISTFVKTTGDYMSAASESYISGNGEKYRLDHYFSGREELTDGRFRTVHPEDIKLKARTKA